MTHVVSTSILVALFGALAVPQGVPREASANSAPPDRCERLRELAGSDYVVREAKLLPAGMQPAVEIAYASAAMLPEHCLFRGTLAPREGAGGQKFGIGFELRMPTKWNGRFLLQGGGAMDGLEFPAYGSMAVPPNAVTRGFAVVRTDSGHRGDSWDDGRFALDQQARLDFSYNALDKVTVEAKQVIKGFYGREPEYSYFMGCSNGGRQAMVAAQRLPLYFDGVIAGNPAHNITRSGTRSIWAANVLAQIAPRDAAGKPIVSKALSDSELELVSKGALKTCDALDGLADGMINDVKGCNFDPSVLTCTKEGQGNCLTKQKVAALKTVMEGPRDRQGRQILSTFPYDTGMAADLRPVVLGTSETAENNSFAYTEMLPGLRYFWLTPPDLRFDPATLDFNDLLERMAPTIAMQDAEGTFLNSFASHGKLILYTGVSDYVLPAGDFTRWYDRLAADTGGRTQDWARLFLVPGMLHCSGGQATDKFDTLAALQDWVERGKAPDQIVATGRAFPGVSRPLCPWPKVARYQGGDPKKHQSFECR